MKVREALICMALGAVLLAPLMSAAGDPPKPTSATGTEQVAQPPYRIPTTRQNVPSVTPSQPAQQIPSDFRGLTPEQRQRLEQLSRCPPPGCSLDPALEKRLIGIEATQYQDHTYSIPLLLKQAGDAHDRIIELQKQLDDAKSQIAALQQQQDETKKQLTHLSVELDIEKSKEAHDARVLTDNLNTAMASLATLKATVDFVVAMQPSLGRQEMPTWKCNENSCIPTGKVNVAIFKN